MKAIIALAVTAIAFSSVRAETLAEIAAKLTEIGAEQIELAETAKDEFTGIERKFKTGALDTPEMKETRRRVESLRTSIFVTEHEQNPTNDVTVLRFALTAAEAELRKAFLEIPEVKTAMEALTAKDAKMKELKAERDRLVALRQKLTAEKE